MIYITEIVLKNIQSYNEEIHFILSPKLTVFIGRNNTGKTAIRRACELFAKEPEDSFLLGTLNRESDTGFVLLKLSDGTYLKAILKRVKRKGKRDKVVVDYIYGSLLDGTVYNKWGIYVPEITDILHWVNITTDSNSGSLSLNFKESGNTIFIDTPGVLNYEVLERLCNIPDLEDRCYRIKAAIVKQDEVLDGLETDIYYADAKLEKMKRVDTSYMEQYKIFLIALKKEIKDLNNFFNAINTYKREQEAFNELIILQNLKNLLDQKITQAMCRELNQSKNNQLLLKHVGTTLQVKEQNFIVEGFKVLSRKQNHANQLLSQTLSLIHYRYLKEQVNGIHQLNQGYHFIEYFYGIYQAKEDLINLEDAKQTLRYIEQLRIRQKLYQKADQMIECKYLSSYCNSTKKDHQEQAILFNLHENTTKMYLAKMTLERKIDEKEVGTVKGLETFICKKYSKFYIENWGKIIHYSYVLTRFLAHFTLEDEMNFCKKQALNYSKSVKIKQILYNLGKLVSTSENAQNLREWHKDIDIEANIHHAIQLIPVCPTCGQVYLQEHGHRKEIVNDRL